MLNVVLIDDEYFFRNSLKHALPWEEHGFQIVGDANNGKSGMELILEKKPDIAIVDINMPILTGLELIENLSQQDVHCRYILLTGYDEFKYAQKAIRLSVSEYILKPVDFSLLLDALNSLKAEILEERERTLHVKSLEERRNIQVRESFLLDLLNGYFSFNETSLADYLKELDIRLPFENYVIFLLDFSKVSSGKLEELRSYLKDSVCKGCISEVFLTGHSQICIIVEADLSSTAYRQGTHIGIYLNPMELNYHIGISSTHHGVEEIIIAYNEARLCLKNAVSRNTPVLDSSKISTSFFHMPEEQISFLKQLIRLKETDRIEEQLNSFYKDFRKKDLSYDNVVFCTYELLSCLFSALNEQNSINCFMDQHSRNLFDTINNLRSFEELQQWVISLFCKQVNTSTPETDEDSSVSARIEQYIQEHYSDMELSIDLISKKLFLNYSYICYCFKRDRDMTINDYINQLRLEKALELFHSGVDNVSFVAEQTGFNNSGYFSKKFKKRFGLSPSEYIKIL